MTSEVRWIILGWLLCGGLRAAAESTNFHFRVEAVLKESYDNNVYLEDLEAKTANVAAAKTAGLRAVEAKEDSWITTLQPKLAAVYQAPEVVCIDASYTPDVNLFYQTPKENFVTHRSNLDFHGQYQDTTLELLNNASYIDGSTMGPTFARPEDVPAIGGITLRDRRAAFIFRNALHFTQRWGDWFVRPVATSYIHDFKTEQVYVPPAARSSYIYENYIDRQEISGGIDVGYNIAAATHLALGYRYGRQDQFDGPCGPGGAQIDSPFDSAYHRVLLSVEGSPFSWLRPSISFGPDCRQFSNEAARSYPGFNRNELLYYVDANLTFLPTQNDTITLITARFEQPAFSSFSVYEDIKSDLFWRHSFNQWFSATVGFTLWIALWQPPMNREDWVYTPNLTLSYELNDRFTVELSSAYDWVDSKVPSSIESFTDGREFTRTTVTLAARYTF